MTLEVGLVVVQLAIVCAKMHKAQTRVCNYNPGQHLEYGGRTIRTSRAVLATLQVPSHPGIHLTFSLLKKKK